MRFKRFALGIAIPFLISASAQANNYDEMRATALKRCENIDVSAYQSGLVFNLSTCARSVFNKPPSSFANRLFVGRSGKGARSVHRAGAIRERNVKKRLAQESPQTEKS